MVEDDLQRQAHRLVAFACKLHQQTMRLIKLELSVGRGAELLELGAFEIVSGTACGTLANWVLTRWVSR